MPNSIVFILSGVMKMLMAMTLPLHTGHSAKFLLYNILIFIKFERFANEIFFSFLKNVVFTSGYIESDFPSGINF